jgi:hypothetical protein
MIGRIDIVGETVRDFKSNVGTESGRAKYLPLFERYLSKHPGGMYGCMMSTCATLACNRFVCPRTWPDPLLDGV